MNNTPLLEEYYAQNAKKIRNMVDKILSGFGGVTQKDYDDFYSLANEVFVDVLRRYDRKQRFDSFLYSCLSNRIKQKLHAETGKNGRRISTLFHLIRP